MFDKDDDNKSPSDLLGSITVDQARLIAARESDPRNSIMALAAHSVIPTRWAFLDFMEEGEQLMIAGAPKAGKSWLALQLALAAASGGRFLQWHATRKMRTLYLNLEVSPNMWAKRVMLQIGGVSNAMAYTEFFSRSDLRTLDVMNPDELKKMRIYIEQGGYDFVVVDVLSRCHSVDENDNGSMKAVLLAIRVMCGKATSVVVHHARKPPAGAEFANLGTASIRGASSIAGEIDSALVLVKRAGQGARYSLSMTARSVDVPDELLLDRSNEDMLYREYEGDASLETVIAAAFRTTGAIPNAELLTIVADGLGIAKDSARRYVSQACAQGLIKREKIGRHVQFVVPETAPYLRVAASGGRGEDCPF